MRDPEYTLYTCPVPPSCNMSIFFYLPALLSSLFRLAVYIFLRVIPTTLAKPVLPALYIAYLLSFWLFLPQPLETTRSEKTAEITHTPKHNIFQILVLSLPTTSSRLRLSNILINTVLFLVAADLVVTPFLDTATDATFTRVGAVYPDSVKVVVRYPETSHTRPTPFRLVYREITNLNSTTWKDGPQLTFTRDEDWVDTVKVTGLWPNTTYEYALSTGNRTILEYPRSRFRFRTSPDPRLSTGAHFKFVVSSCVYPNFPYRGPLHRRSIRGFDLLADYLYPPSVESSNVANDAVTPAYNLEASPKAEFMLFLGDFIYADVPVYIGDNKEA